jgi:hypothetical protein
MIKQTWRPPISAIFGYLRIYFSGKKCVNSESWLGRVKGPICETHTKYQPLNPFAVRENPKKVSTWPSKWPISAIFGYLRIYFSGKKSVNSESWLGRVKGPICEPHTKYQPLTPFPVREHSKKVSKWWVRAPCLSSHHRFLISKRRVSDFEASVTPEKVA